MITDLIQEKNCFMIESVSDWKEAVRVACRPMIEQGFCTEEYEKAVFESTEKYGPYYVLCENLALIHASLAAGVNETQMAVTVLKKPVKFSPNGYDVRVLVTLVAKDRVSHMEGIQSVSNIFSDPEKVQKILDAPSTKEIYDLFISSTCENK